MRKLNKAKSYGEFIYEKYTLNTDDRSASFFYCFDPKNKTTEPIHFVEKITFPENIEWAKINKKLLNTVLFNLHLALGVSYYKAFCPPNIIVRSGVLGRDEAEFWNKLYTKGLGEFFYRNNIDYRGLVNFPFSKNKKSAPIKVKLINRVLAPIGGGKDSCVAIEKLKTLGHDYSLISLGDSEAQNQTAKIAGGKRLIFGRTIDKKLIELNSAGAFNGHVPISSIYSFITLLGAVLYNYKNIVFSNEASANFGNVNYLGEKINHQYSKSLEFENDLRAYIKNSISPDINYFSILRSFSELFIAGEFAKLPQYFSAFVSCNRHFALNPQNKTRWCGSCPKCAFVFCQLSAYIPKNKLVELFNKNLFADKLLLPLFQELWGEKRFKPFECVGEPNEVTASFLLAIKNNEWKNDFIVNYFLKKRLPKIKNTNTVIQSALKINPSPNIPLDYKKVLVLGYGHEGKYTAEYLNKLYPKLVFAVADQKPIAVPPPNATVIFGDNYLEAIYDYDVIIKSPGLSDQKPEIKAVIAMGQEVTTVTNIFLEQFANTTIGVTGTKGKSTTASLIYAMLRAGHVKAELVGNIGTDPLKFLNKKNTVFVYELSSYQLSLVKHAPHVAVFINIFPDHLPYHGGYNEYFLAKAKIAKSQNKNDVFIYNSNHKELNGLAKESKAKKINYLKTAITKNDWLYVNGEKIVPLSEINLLGKHNIENIVAAISAVKLYGVGALAIRKAIKKFKNLKHRLEFVGTYKEIDFYDDAISTTPESTIAGINVFGNNLGTIILGGQDRGYNFDELAKKIISLKINGIILFPESGDKIETALISASKKLKIELPAILRSQNMKEAVKFCYQQTPKNKVCLLSTASPSYSIFKNFEDKGDQFQKEIKNQQ